MTVLTHRRGRTLAALSLILALLMLLLCACKDAGDSSTAGTNAGTEPSAQTEEVPGTTTETASKEEIAQRSVYTVDDLTGEDPRLDAVIATYAGEKLTNRQFQIYYSMQFFDFMNSYGMYAAYFGLDTTKALSAQDSYVTGLTWEQLFAKFGLVQFQQFAAVTAKAKEEGFTLSEEDETSLQEAIDGLEEQAKESGYDSVDAFVQGSFGDAVQLADYEAFMRTYFYVMSYENKVYKEVTWTDEDLVAYFESHKDDQEYQTLSTDDVPNINVRHILIQPVDADDDNTISDEEKETARKKAEELLETWKQDPTEQNFASLAETHSTDGGSKSNGGLYEDVYPGQMVPTFNDWCFESSRKIGDTGIVETDYGYHIMYFVSNTDHYQWKILAQRDYPASRVYTMVNELTEASPIEVDYDAIVLSPLPLAETAEE